MARQKLSDETIDLPALRVPADVGAYLVTLIDDTGLSRAEAHRLMLRRAMEWGKPSARQRAARSAESAGHSNRKQTNASPVGAASPRGASGADSAPSHDVTPIPKASWKQ